MNKIKKETIAQFRFRVIADIVCDQRLTQKQESARIRELAQKPWNIPYSQRSHISSSTIRRWIRLYKNSSNDLASLYPQTRKDQGQFRNIDQETFAVFQQLQKEYPDTSIANLIRIARKEGRLAEGTKLVRATLYRLFKTHKLTSKKQTIAQDRLKYEAPYPNHLWQADVMYGPQVEINASMKTPYLIGIIDDMSRLLIHGRFYPNEKKESFFLALQESFSRWGLPEKLYVDNGAAFRSHQLQMTCARLGVNLIHSPPRVPQGKGKIERFFRTVRLQFLATLPKNLSFSRLNERFSEWIKEYHAREHSSTGMPPMKRFVQHSRDIKTAPYDLSDYFRMQAVRKVRKDRTVFLGGHSYVAPVELIDKRVDLLYHPQALQEVEVFYQNRSFGFLEILDLQVNSRVKRQGSRKSTSSSQEEDSFIEDKESILPQSGELFSPDKEGDIS